MNPIAAMGLTVGYPQKKGSARILLEATDLQFRKGKLVALMGANGAGKSSLLRVLAGIQEPLQGKVRWNDRALSDIPLAERPKWVAALFRSFARTNGLSLWNLVALGRHPYTGFFGKLTSADRAAVDAAIDQVGMQSFAHASIHTLSDGEFQKAMVAKMLAQDASVMLLDEPTTHLDLPSAIELLQLLSQLTAGQGKTVVFSTHNVALALQLADDVLLLGEGGKAVMAPPDDIANHELMCGFLRSSHVRIENGNLRYTF